MHGIEIRYQNQQDSYERGEVIVVADVKCVEQVLKNILHQTVRYANNNSKIRVVHWVDQEAASERLCFKVSFTGKMKTTLIDEEGQLSEASTENA